MSVHGGWLAEQETDATFILGGLTTAPVYTYSGYRLGAAFGMSVTPNVSIEGEISYTTAALNEADFTADAGPEIPVEGHALNLSLMANVMLGADVGGWTPYVGVGIGAVNVSLDIPDGGLAGGGDGVDDDAWTWGRRQCLGQISM